ncbi:MAG: hypothetical protein AB8B80_06755 [Marinicellaceae bacterium]
MKNLILSMLLLLISFSNKSHSQSQTRIENILEIIYEIKNLADEFELTKEQKTKVRLVLMNYLPDIALDASAMITNRKNLLASNLTNSTENEENLEDYMLEIANQQGQLLTNIIISKEHMKNEIKVILTDDQQNFVDDLISAIIQFRMNHS